MTTPTTVAPDTLTLWGYLPQFVKTSDATNTYTFLTWLNGAGAELQVLDDLCRDSGAVPGWSVIMNVSSCPPYALPWLAQLVGVRFTGTTINTVPAQRSAIIALGNFARGTPAAIEKAVQPYLGLGGTVQIIERYPDPYSLSIVIHGATSPISYAQLAKTYPFYPTVSTAFPNYDDFTRQTSAAILAVVKNAIPGGIVATVEIET